MDKNAPHLLCDQVRRIPKNQRRIGFYCPSATLSRQMYAVRHDMYITVFLFSGDFFC